LSSLCPHLSVTCIEEILLMSNLLRTAQRRTASPTVAPLKILIFELFTIIVIFSIYFMLWYL